LFCLFATTGFARNQIGDRPSSICDGKGLTRLNPAQYFWQF